MKFVSFLQNNQAKFGISDGKNITDLTGKIKGANTLKELIANKLTLEAKEFSKKKNLIIVCGRYEGIDQRVLDNKVDEECSVGDFVVTGGEIPALLVTEAVSRFIPGVVGDSQSVDDDSFSQGLLEYPQFTRPEKDESGEVPQVLLSGDHKKISKWRLKQSILKTYKNRPDLLNSRDMTEEEKIWLKEIINEEGK